MFCPSLWPPGRPNRRATRRRETPWGARLAERRPRWIFTGGSTADGVVPWLDPGASVEAAGPGTVPRGLPEASCVAVSAVRSGFAALLISEIVDLRACGEADASPRYRGNCLPLSRRWRCVPPGMVLAAGRGAEADRAISTGQLRGLPRFHLRPIDVMVSNGSRRDLVLRRVSRLDAFSGYPIRT